MVAYSFKERFVAPIQDNVKHQTIRAPRKGRSRHARAGDDLQLYTAMRTKYCTLIGRSICIDVSDIRLSLSDAMAWITEQDGGLTTIYRCGMDEFARNDGFSGFDDMRQFWVVQHPGITVFDGVLIRWGGFMTGRMETTNG